MSKLLRIIDKETKVFLRDDFTFDSETEIGLDVEPAQGFIKPKWSCVTVDEVDVCEWIEGV